MYDSPSYPTDPVETEAFVAGQRHGTLVATPPDGHLQATILPFLKRGGVIERHCVREDPANQVRSIRGPRCSWTTGPSCA